jgi:hypothetical protein
VWLWFFATTAQGDATAAMALDKPASEEFAKVAGDVEPI